MEDARLQRLRALQSFKRHDDGNAVITMDKDNHSRRERIRAEVVYSKCPTSTTDNDRLADKLQKAQLDEQQHITEVNLEKIKESPVPSAKPEEKYSETEEEYLEPLQRPVFIPKLLRPECSSTQATDDDIEAKRQEEAHRLLVDYVRKDYEATFKSQDDDSVLGFDPLSVDDTDELDEEGEYAAWRLRELLRIKRDKEERERWEKEKMEAERVRNMTEEERRLQDEAKAKEWAELPKGEMKYMQKYYHKGSFFLDDHDPLMRRDYMQPTGEDASANRETLPEIKQVRDFGKKGRTKWTHLVGEDTTAFDYGWGQRKNEMNYKLISKMGGMRGHLDNPVAKRTRKE